MTARCNRGLDLQRYTIFLIWRKFFSFFYIIVSFALKNRQLFFLTRGGLSGVFRVLFFLLCLPLNDGIRDFSEKHSFRMWISSGTPQFNTLLFAFERLIDSTMTAYRQHVGFLWCCLCGESMESKWRECAENVVSEWSVLPSISSFQSQPLYSLGIVRRGLLESPLSH